MAAHTSSAKLLAALWTLISAVHVGTCSSDNSGGAGSEETQLSNIVRNFYVNSSSRLIPTLKSVQGYVANESGGYFRLHIASGHYHLSGPNATALATFVNLSNITIVGADVSDTVIDGVGSAGFVFKDVRYLTISNLTFTNCSSVQNSSSTNGSSVSDGPLSFVEFAVSLYLVACSDVLMENVTISNSLSLGLAMFNTRGNNVFTGSTFTDNGQPSLGSSLLTRRGGGGGAVIEFSFCQPGDLLCNITTPVEVADASFEFTNCEFVSNTVSSLRLGPVSIYPHGLEHSGFGKGGGLAMYFRGRSINNSILLINCHISGNYAEAGGGLYIEFGDESQGNTFTFTGKDGGISRIDNNGDLCPPPSSNGTNAEANGGGAKIVFMYYPPDPNLWPGYHADVTGNHVQFHDTYITSNMGCNGGGVAFISSRADLWTRQSNTILFSNCTFQDNTASVSAALDISVLHPDTTTGGELMVPVIHQCVFHSNEANSRSDGSIPDLAGYQFGNGALYIDTVPTNFSGVNSFTSNKGTGLVILGANVAVTMDTTLVFEGNSGRRGGAMVVIGRGALIMFPGAHLNFSQNKALELGGAIYNEGQFGERDATYKEKCFVRYYQPTVPPTHWNVTFSFSNNSAGYRGNSTIHLTSLLTCVWPDSGSRVTDIRETLCWPGWVYNGHDAKDIESCSPYITTAPGSFNNSYTNLIYQIRLYPGHHQPIPVRVKDDYGNLVNNVVYQLSPRNQTVADVSDDSVYITDNKVSVYGVPDSTKKQDFFLETLGPRILSTVLQVIILPCPPGYAPQSVNSTDTAMVAKCKCGYSLYFTCNTSAMTARILPGYCVHYSGNNTSHSDSFLTQSELTHLPIMIVVQCPATVKKSKPITLPVCGNSTCNIEKEFCRGVSRTGTFCSDCMKGHAVDVNDIHDCVKCSGNDYHYGWLVYILTNIVPVTLFFVIVAIFKISATSAPMYGFVFFAQIMTVQYFHNQYPWIYGLSEKRYELQPLLLSPYAIWNLDFFIFKNIICLGSDLTTMYSLLLKYLLALYPMLLILFSYVCIELYDRNFRIVVWLWRPFRACFKKFRRTWQPRTSIIDAFAAFLMISYTKIAFITISLLTPAQEYYVYHDRRTEVPDGYVFYFDPQYRYFQGQHLVLGLLALVVGVVFVLAPPIFLVLYPTELFQRCLNRWSQCSWQPVHTFADAFQGCFKNRTNNNRDYRYISGLYLILRVVILIIYAVESLLFLQLLLQQLICILAVLLFSLVRPYKEAFYNKVDLTIFSLLSVMNSLSFANLTYANLHNREISSPIFVINYILGFLPLTYITVYVVYLLLKWRGVIAVDPTVRELTVGKSVASIMSEDSSYADVPDRLLHPENYTISPPPSIPSCDSGSEAPSSPDVASGDERLVINRGRPKQRATEGSYFLKKSQYMKNYSSI